MRKYLIFGVFTAFVFMAGMAVSGDVASQKAEAMKLWPGRMDLAQALKAAELFEAAAKADPKDPKIAEMAVRSFYWLGINQTEKAKKQEYHRRGYDLGMLLIKTQPKNVGIYYWAASNIARYAQTLSDFEQKTYIVKINPLMNKVLELDKNYFYGGGPRYLAILTTEMSPTLRKFAAATNKDFKFTLEEAVQACRDAIKIETNYFLNHTTLAEALIASGKKDEAKKELEWVLANDPAKLPDCKPENIFEQGRARDMLKKL